jgi:hypothetical protein
VSIKMLLGKINRHWSATIGFAESVSNCKVSVPGPPDLAVDWGSERVCAIPAAHIIHVKTPPAAARNSMMAIMVTRPEAQEN